MTTAILSWEYKRNAMMKENGRAEVPPIWTIAAFLELCPKDVREQVYLRIDEIGDNFEVLKQKVIAWITNQVEQERGAQS